MKASDGAYTQAERVLWYLQNHSGCTTMELQFALQPFVSNPRARISDLRKRGVNVVCFLRDDGNKGYRIVAPRPVTTGEQQGLSLV